MVNVHKHDFGVNIWKNHLKRCFQNQKRCTPKTFKLLSVFTTDIQVQKLTVPLDSEGPPKRMAAHQTADCSQDGYNREEHLLA